MQYSIATRVSPPLRDRDSAPAGQAVTQAPHPVQPWRLMRGLDACPRITRPVVCPSTFSTVAPSRRVTFAWRRASAIRECATHTPQRLHESVALQA